MARLAVFLCLVACMSEAAPQASQPAASAPAESAQQRLNRIQSARPESLTQPDRALAAALDFYLGLAEADAPRATRRVDAIGYQPLPLTGELPADAVKPIRAADLARRIQEQDRSRLADVSAERFVLLQKDALAAHFPAAAAWMASGDFAVLLDPPVGLAGWSDRASCVIVRVRATRATVIGGNVFASLEASP